MLRVHCVPVDADVQVDESGEWDDSCDKHPAQMNVEERVVVVEPKGRQLVVDYSHIDLIGTCSLHLHILRVPELKELGDVEDDAKEDCRDHVSGHALPLGRGATDGDILVVLNWPCDCQVPLHSQDDCDVVGTHEGYVLHLVEEVDEQQHVDVGVDDVAADHLEEAGEDENVVCGGQADQQQAEYVLHPGG